MLGQPCVQGVSRLTDIQLSTAPTLHHVDAVGLCPWQVVWDGEAMPCRRVSDCSEVLESFPWLHWWAEFGPDQQLLEVRVFPLVFLCVLFVHEWPYSGPWVKVQG